MNNTPKSQPDALAPKRVTRPKRRTSPVKVRATLNKAAGLHGGGLTALAKTLKRKYGTVAQWARSGSVPPEQAPVIESMYPGQIKADDLCPAVPWHLIRASQDAEVARLTALVNELLAGARDFVAYEAAMNDDDNHIEAMQLYASASDKLQAAVAEVDAK